MAMQHRIRGVRPDRGGYVVAVEIEGAYADGSSRFEEAFLSTAEVRGKTLSQLRQAVFASLGDGGLSALIGEAVAAPAVDRDILEDRMVELYERWQRWKATRAEAQARGMAAAVVTALTARENAAWAAYGDAIAAWRNA